MIRIWKRNTWEWWIGFWNHIKKTGAEPTSEALRPTRGLVYTPLFSYRTSFLKPLTYGLLVVAYMILHSRAIDNLKTQALEHLTSPHIVTFYALVSYPVAYSTLAHFNGGFDQNLSWQCIG